MKNQFVPYELAVKLEELGFNEPCLMHWFQYWAHELPKNLRGGGIIVNEGNPIRLSRITTPELNRDLKCGAPLWQQAFNWFRESHGLLGFIENGNIMNNIRFNAYINSIERSEVGSNVVREANLFDFISYEEASYACIEKLIELATKKNFSYGK